MTVYPRTQQEAVSVADELHRLTRSSAAPAVPYDRPFRDSKCIFYRYGAFDSDQELENGDGTRTPAIRNRKGKLVPDQRAHGAAVPNWLVDPFLRSKRNGRAGRNVGPLPRTLRAFEALSQRGKGGVYRALDLSVSPARLSVLKEGRRHGETDWDGRDGFWRVKHEGSVLSALSAAGVAVPKLYQTFKTGSHYYLVIEFIEGANLQTLLSRKGKRISLRKALLLSKRVAELISQVHQAGWVWRDCKPLNLILSQNGTLRPIDFEGACPINHADSAPWGTEGYVPAEFSVVPENGSRAPEDLYALGATLQQLLSARRFKPGDRLQKHHEVRPEVSLRVKKLIRAFFNPNPQLRPSASDAAKILTRASFNSQ